ncbi:hypothetical protein VNO80_29421 [Phaseolus coccineus]|uniref:Uncharacterized protein n=1 Tax=Phaseolus coccineus TaxID=3886 RepID=A0AAN9LC61_PHACN
MSGEEKCKQKDRKEYKGGATYFFIPYLSLAVITNSSAIGSTLPSPSGKGSVCSGDYVFLSLDLGGVVLLVENRPLEGRENFLVVNNYLIIA